TLLVLLCFNLLGEGFEVAAPRVYDTLLGCAIAWAAVSFIWPDWKFRQLPAVVTIGSTGPISLILSARSVSQAKGMHDERN
ncbi:hypothetical protein SB781_36750, partial [Paraburkholderia sp. SIMBA_061]